MDPQSGQVATGYFHTDAMEPVIVVPLRMESSMRKWKANPNKAWGETLRTEQLQPRFPSITQGGQQLLKVSPWACSEPSSTGMFGWRAKLFPGIQGPGISCQGHRHFHTHHERIRGAEGTSGLQVDWAQSSKNVGTPGPLGQQPQTLIWQPARYPQTSSNASIPQQTSVQAIRWPGGILQKTANLQERYWAQRSFSHCHRKHKLSGSQVIPGKEEGRKKGPNWEFNFELKGLFTVTKNWLTLIGKLDPHSPHVPLS